MFDISDLSKAGDRRLKGLMMSRLLVVVSVVAIPIFIFVLFTRSDQFAMNLIPSEWRDLILIVTPWFFTFGWVFMLALFASRIAGALDAMDEHIQVIPARYKLFYGLNALALLVLFAIPILTPAISVLAFASAGYRLATIKTDWNEIERTPISAVILAIIFAAIPTVISIATLPDMLSFSEYMWFGYWVRVIPPLYTISLALSTALTFGSVVILVKTGAAEYENAYYKSSNKEPFNKINVIILEIIVFALLIFLEYYEVPFKNLIYVVGFIMICFNTIVNFIKGRKQADFRSYTFGYIITMVLYGANLLSWDALGLSEEIELLVIMISASAYILIYIIIFFTYRED
ncbi:MAG: hypothetical protein GF364_18910 [Candidatus Lokiarchaeota archaeon]|nr:hypothetical protein [Candidatus Lokiarchaeota archaeon]